MLTVGTRSPAGAAAGLPRTTTPLPNGCDVLRDPSDRCVMDPLPNGRVVPVTVFPVRDRSVLTVPLPNGRVVVVVPSDQRVTVPLPNGMVVPVSVRPRLSRSRVIEPDPNG